jgi:O-antigen/teichoic acid export membrane protein
MSQAAFAARTELEPRHVKPLSLRRNFSWTFVANAYLAVANAVVLWLLVQWTDDSTVGHFILGLAIATPLFVLTDLGLRTVQATDSRRDYDFGDYLALRIVTSLTGMAFILAILPLRGYEGQKAWIIVLLGASKMLDSLADVFYGLFQQHERMDWISWSMLMKSGTSIPAFFVVLWATGNVVVSVAMLGLARLTFLLLYDAPMAARTISSAATSVDARPSWFGGWNLIRPIWHARIMRKLFWLAAPLGITTVLVSLNSSIPRLAIEEFQGDGPLGVYGLMAYFVVLGQMIVSALGGSASPRLSRYYAEGRHQEFRALTWKLVALGALTGLAMFLTSLFAGRYILATLGKPRYVQQVQVLHWLMLAAGIGYIGSFLGYVMTATRAFRMLVVPFVAVTLLAVAAAWLLVPRFGLEGAAWTTLLVNVGYSLVPVYVLGKVDWKRGASAG